jgi:hypothetical protein
MMRQDRLPLPEGLTADGLSQDGHGGGVGECNSLAQREPTEGGNRDLGGFETSEV